MRRRGRDRSGGAEKAAEILFALTLRGEGGSVDEVVVTDADEVVYRCCEAGARPFIECLPSTRRDIDSFLWRVERLDLARWKRTQGGAGASGPGSWHVAFQSRTGWVMASGSGEHPEWWGEMCRLVERVSGKDLG